MTYRRTLTAVSVVAASLAASTGTALAAGTGNTQIAEHNRHHRHSYMSGAPCRFLGARVSPRFVRIRARRAGYRRIHDIRFVPRRHGRYNWCGFFRAEARFRGRPFVIYADAHTGRVIGRTRRGRLGAHHRRNLAPRQVRAILHRHGYRHIRNIRYVQRGRRDFYVARARRHGWVVRLRIDDESGRIIHRQRLRRMSRIQRSPDLSQRELRGLLRAKGYSGVRAVEYRQIATAPGYAAVAEYDGVSYRLHVSGTTGKVEAKRRLR